MTLLFIENRYKTYFFEPIAEQLKEKGYKVHFLIQNKGFSLNQSFTKHVIPYPKNKEETNDKIGEVETIVESDRQQNYFKKKSKFYFYYYYHKIDKILDLIQPDFVFGESTAFHELITISLCKKKNILYLNPSSCRYPIGRFSFYKYDTLEPYKGSGEILSDAIALDTVNSIINRSSRPDYMQGGPSSRIAKIKNKFRLIKGYLAGERYNTPNPIIKNNLEKQKRKNIVRWDLFAKERLEGNTNFKVLYPLQMQPEANIDVWGKAYRDQTKFIQEMLKNLPSNAVLFVKPNPKSKYELTDELIKLVQHSSNCIAISHSVKMDDIIHDMDLVVTVTGTIAIECILSNKPIITMVQTLNSKASNCIYLESLNNNLKPIIETIINNNQIKLPDSKKIEYINLLNTTSFKGVVSDPFTDINCIDSDNINNMTLAFQDILK